MRASRRRFAVAAAVAVLALAPTSSARAAAGRIGMSSLPRQLELEPGARATLRIGGAGSPAVHASVGTVGPLRPVASGVYEAEYVPPRESHPQVAIITATTPEAFGWLALPLAGTGELQVRTDPRAEATVRIGDRLFGPVRADGSGRASIPIVVPPGTTHAEFEGRRIALATPEPVRPFAVLAPASVPASERGVVAVRVFVVDEKGGPRRGVELRFRASAGTVSKPREVEPGVYEARWDVPPGSEEASLATWIAGAPRNALQASLQRTGPAKRAVPAVTGPAEPGRGARAATPPVAGRDRQAARAQPPRQKPAAAPPAARKQAKAEPSPPAPAPPASAPPAPRPEEPPARAPAAAPAARTPSPQPVAPQAPVSAPATTAPARASPPIAQAPIPPPATAAVAEAAAIPPPSRRLPLPPVPPPRRDRPAGVAIGLRSGAMWDREGLRALTAGAQIAWFPGALGGYLGLAIDGSGLAVREKERAPFAGLERDVTSVSRIFPIQGLALLRIPVPGGGALTLGGGAGAAYGEIRNEARAQPTLAENGWASSFTAVLGYGQRLGPGSIFAEVRGQQVDAIGDQQVPGSLELLGASLGYRFEL